MATIVFLEHLLQGELGVGYMLHHLGQRWARAGHRVLAHRGTQPPPPGDLAFFHVDSTVVPEAYWPLVERYPRVVNAAVRDISKRRISDAILARGSDWAGPVLVKADRNYGGRPEAAMRLLALGRGLVPDVPEAPPVMEYTIHPSLDAVPAAVWETPSLVVEKFLPEIDARGYCLRVWTFFGERDRSNRYFAREPLIKAANYIGREPAAVPDEMREIRRRLGFEYGKFDYVCHEGRYHLLDANRTPALGRMVSDPGMMASLDEMAEALGAFL